MATWLGVDSDYNSAVNWTGGDVPNTAGETAQFSSAGTTSVVLSASIQADKWLFDPVAKAYTITVGFTADLGQGGGGSGIVNSSLNTQKINVISGGHLTFANASTSGSNVKITIQS